MQDDTFSLRAGFVAVIGRPNAGKSTLINYIVGQKVSIVSDKPQTTRRRLLGIATTPDYQIVFVDTPGVHHAQTQLAKIMLENVQQALSGVDLILFVADASKKPGPDDEAAALYVRQTVGVKVLLCLNKMDLLKPIDVEAHVQGYCKLVGTEDYMLTSFTRGENVDKLVAMILERLPHSPPLYPEDEITDQSSRFLVAELIREKVLRLTRQEVPHATAVFIDQWEESEALSELGAHIAARFEDRARRKQPLVRISAVILVEQDGQKAILIGRGGAMLKRIGTESRQEIEDLLGKRAFLELFVKVKNDWRQNPRILRELELLQ